MSPRKHDSRREPPAPETDEPGGPSAEQEPGDESRQEADSAPRSGWGEGAAAADLEALRAENAELKDRMLRSMAEMENLRRRTERDKADTAKYAISAFARDVLNVGDNIARAIAAVPDGAAAADSALKALVEGVEVTERELQNVLDRHGIRKLDPKGERFDPNLHQAMLEMEDTEVPVGTILEVLQPGYVIQDRVLRPALVAVSKGGERAPKADPASGEGGEGGEGAEPAAPRSGEAREAEKSPRTRNAGPLGGQVDRSA